MAFDLDADRPLHASLLDSALAECTQAQQAIAAPSAENIHAARKSIKRLRAWLRLVKPQIGKQFLVIDRLLRDAARRLAGRREAHVAQQTLLSLRRGRLLDAAQYAALKAMIERDSRDGSHDHEAEQQALVLLRTAGIYLTDLDLRAIDEGVLRAALSKSRQQCRRRWKRAGARPSIEALHEWRKTVKHLATQASLLATRLDRIDIDSSALKSLADDLGSHHDYAELRARLEGAGLDLQALLHLRLRDAVQRRQQALELRALRRGAGLLS